MFSLWANYFPFCHQVAEEACGVGVTVTISHSGVEAGGCCNGGAFLSSMSNLEHQIVLFRGDKTV